MRIVHAREGRLLLESGGPGGVGLVLVLVSFWEVWVPFWGLVWSERIGGGEASRDMVVKRSRGFTVVKVRLHVGDHP